MSDTPIDRDLDTKSSTRYSTWFKEQIEQFREEYNAEVADLGLDDEMEEAFHLEYTSDARRRLIDFGLFLWGANQRPVGFAFDVEELTGEDDVHLDCTNCGQSDPLRFRVGLGAEQEFTTVHCLGCGHTASVEEQTRTDSLWAL